jgi:hypothetical protein
VSKGWNRYLSSDPGWWGELDFSNVRKRKIKGKELSGCLRRSRRIVRTANLDTQFLPDHSILTKICRLPSLRDLTIQDDVFRSSIREAIVASRTLTRLVLNMAISKHFLTTILGLCESLQELRIKALQWPRVVAGELEPMEWPETTCRLLKFRIGNDIAGISFSSRFLVC